MSSAYLRQTISCYATDGEEFLPPREGYHLKWAQLIAHDYKWALIWEMDDEYGSVAKPQ